VTSVFGWICPESDGGGHEREDDRVNNEHGKGASIEDTSLQADIEHNEFDESVLYKHQTQLICQDRTQLPFATHQCSYGGGFAQVEAE
jgi:hypothetical protein